MSKTTHISITKIRNGISYNTLHEKVKSQYENGFNSYKENAKGPSHKNNKEIYTCKQSHVKNSIIIYSIEFEY